MEEIKPQYRPEWDKKTSGERESRAVNRMGREEEYLMDLTERTLSSETVYLSLIHI